MSVRMRQEVEMKIAVAFINSALAKGYTVGVNNGEDDYPPMTDVEAIKKLMMQTDEEHLTIFKNGKKVGWVFLVYGNSGYDVISDYSTNLEPLMGDANKIANHYSQ